MQNRLIKFIDLSYNMHPGVTDPLLILDRHAEAMGYLDFLKDKFDITVIEHINYTGQVSKNGISFCFFKGRKSFWYLPFTVNRFVKQQKADIVMVQGLIFPLQVILLRFALGRRTKIICQHHGGNPPRSRIKRLFARFADQNVNAYFFTAKGNMKPWVQQGIIAGYDKGYEVLEASTGFRRKDKQDCRKRLGLGNEDIFLWAARLNDTKNPLLVLRVFEEYLAQKPGAKLYMVYQTEELLPEVKQKIEHTQVLKNGVKLIGRVEHREMNDWFSAADYYVSASSNEGSGYALIEAMACGCIPVVSDIPPFRKITGDGKYGFLFRQGNSDDFLSVLIEASRVGKEKWSDEIVTYFERELSFKAISQSIYIACSKLF